MSLARTEKWLGKAASLTPTQRNLENSRSNFRQAKSSISGSTGSEVVVWRSYSGEANDQAIERVALIAKDGQETKSIALDLVKMGYEVHHTTDLDAMLDSVLAQPKDWHFIMFDLDFFESIEDAVDDLTAFRETCWSIPVLLMSSAVSRDEFSDYRRSVGDATLRKPVYHARLQDGIVAMKQNSETALLTSA